MARNSEFVSGIGSTGNFASGLSNSLANMSNVFNRQHQNEVAEQERAKKDLLFKQNQKAIQAEKDFNRFAADLNPNNVKYGIEHLSPKLAKDAETLRNVVYKDKDIFESYLTGDKSEESLDNAIKKYEANLKLAAYEPAEIKDKVTDRRKYLKMAGDEVSRLPEEQRNERIEALSGSLFGKRINDIESRISNGSYLIRKEKIDAVIARLPENVRNSVPYEKLYKTVALKVGGTTAEDIKQKEALRVDAKNKLEFEAAKRAVSGYNNSQKNNYKASWTGKDVTEHLKAITGKDIGSWDDDDLMKASADLLSKNIHPAAITAATEAYIDKGIIDDSFINKEDDPEEYAKFENLARSISSGLTKGNNGTIKVQPPGNFNFTSPEDLYTLRRRSMKVTGDATRLRDLLTPTQQPVAESNDYSTSGSFLERGQYSSDIMSRFISSQNVSRTTEPQVTPSEVDNTPVSEIPNTPVAEEVMTNRNLYDMEKEKTRQLLDLGYGKELNLGDKETVTVLPFDEAGNKRTWREIVLDVNSRDQLNRKNKISPIEAKDAQNNTELQKRYLRRSNDAILEDIALSADNRESELNRKNKWANIEKSPVYRSIYDYVKGVEAFSEENKTNLEKIKEKEITMETAKENLSVLKNYLTSKNQKTSKVSVNTSSRLKSLLGKFEGRNIK